jgi:hypothetical protein
MCAGAEASSSRSIGSIGWLISGDGRFFLATGSSVSRSITSPSLPFSLTLSLSLALSLSVALSRARTGAGAIVQTKE